MVVGIHNDPYGKFNDFLRKYEIILDYNGITHRRMDINDFDFWDVVKNLDLFIFRWKHIDDHHQLAKTILPIIENELGIKCFPNMATCWHFDDKIRQYYLMKNYGFPFIQSWVFWDKKEALDWFNKTDLPIVFKLKGGAGSANVVLIKSREQGKRLINKIFSRGILTNKIPDASAILTKEFNLYKTVHHWGGNVLRVLRGEDAEVYWQLHKNYVYFQKFLPNNDYDTRITIIGKRAFGFRRYVRKSDFRASGSGKIDYDIKGIDPRCIEIALDISQKMGFQCMAYDFLMDMNKPFICEISYNFVESAIYECPGYWDTDIKWHTGHYWPQYFQLMYALDIPDLKQPEITS